MGTDDLESCFVLVCGYLLLHLINHDCFGKNAFKITSGQLKYYSPLSNCNYSAASLDQSVIQQILPFQIR